MRSIVLSILSITFAGMLVGCSGASQTTQQSQSSKQMEVQKYPSWYASQKVVSEEDMMYAYATAIGEDSASAVSKAVSWAEKELQSSVSEKLENIRSDAVVELGSQSGLDAPRFLIALRKADRAVSPLVETRQTEVKTVEGYNSYRSFAEVRVPKEQLIERIGKRLAGYEKAWNAMKESKAFENF